MSKPENIIPITDEFSEEENLIYGKTYIFIKGFAMGAELPLTMIALSVARKMHSGQFRNTGEPYILHPLKVCDTLISLGIRDDATLAASLLHDVTEDCQDKLPLGGKELVSEYHLTQEVLDIITLLSKESGSTQHELSVYFNKIKMNPKSLLIKLSDRNHNSQTLYSMKTQAKIRKYIKESEDFIFPLCSYGKCYYPELSNPIKVLKEQIMCLNSVTKIMMDKTNIPSE